MRANINDLPPHSPHLEMRRHAAYSGLDRRAGWLAGDQYTFVHPPMRQRRARQAAPTPRRRVWWWSQLLIAVAVVFAYANSLTGPLIYDDRGTILDNTTIEDLRSSRVLVPPHETSVAGRPIANLSFAVNYAFGGREVAGYHVVNVAVHLLCALAIFGIARRTQLSDSPATAVALVWAVHPLNTEAVDYLTQRTESLMALFYLTTLYCGIRAHAATARRRLWAAGAIGACGLGMATKESMVTAPVILLLYDRVFLFSSLRDAMHRRWALYAGLAATWCLLGALVWGGPRNLSAGFSAQDANVRTYLLNQAILIVRYLRLAIWPRDLVLYYGWPLPLSLRAVLPHLLVVIALLGLTGWALWRRPRLGFLGAWFFIALAPTSSIIPIATEVGAERRMYLPLVALVGLAVVAVRSVLTAPRLRAVALAVVTVLLGTATILRNAEYRSSLRLAETTVERWPTPAAHSMLGTELAAAGRLSEAESHLRQAAAAYPPARYYLGTVLAAEGHDSDAIESFKSFIAEQPPELDQVRLAREGLATSRTRLAQGLLRQERFAEAIPILRDITAEQSGDAWAFGALGVALASTERTDEAIEAFRRQVELDPQNEHARQNLARAMRMHGR